MSSVFIVHWISSGEGSNFGHSHRLETSPLTHGLDYLSACDVTLTYKEILNSELCRT